MHEAALGVARLRPGVGKQQEQAVQTGVRQHPQQPPGVIGPQAQIAGQRRGRFPALRHQARQQRADAVLEYLAGDQRRPRGARRSAPARARRRRNRPPARVGAGRGERGQRVVRRVGGKRQPRQGDIEQELLAGPQLMAAAAAIQPVGRRLLATPACVTRRRLPAERRLQRRHQVGPLPREGALRRRPARGRNGHKPRSARRSAGSAADARGCRAATGSSPRAGSFPAAPHPRPCRCRADRHRPTAGGETPIA